MACGECCSIAMRGLHATLVTVEAHCGQGLPTLHIVGKADTAVREAGDRVRSAFQNSALPWPRQKVTLSLSPADLPKNGSHFDLAIALAILSAQQSLPALMSPPRVAVFGELSLTGRIMPISGVLPTARAAWDNGITTLIVPEDNYREARLVEGMSVLTASHLRDLTEKLYRCDAGPDGTLMWERDVAEDEPPTPPSSLGSTVDFAQLKGQESAVEAAVIAAAGAHHLLLLGPPGSGKSMIAQRLPGILPPLTYEHALEVTAVHSIAGTVDSRHPLVRQPPFVAPHLGITPAALIGGGSGIARPGAVSRAHRGVLFLDECMEMSSSLLDLLRVPLHDGEIHITRSGGTVTYPTQVQLVLAGNPCPCGAARPDECQCPSAVRVRYRARLSGPLVDRIDIRVRLQPVGLAAVTGTRGRSSAELRSIVVDARERAAQRWGSAVPNGAVSDDILEQHPLPTSTLQPLFGDLQHGLLSARGLSRITRLAWTLADIVGKEQPQRTEIIRAHHLRRRLNDM